WVVASLDGCQSFPGPVRVRLMHPGLPVDTHEVHVSAWIVALQSLPEVLRPGLVLGGFVWVVVEGSDVDHDRPRAVRIGCGVGRHAANGTTQDADLRRLELGVRRLEMLDDGLRSGLVKRVDE